MRKTLILLFIGFSFNFSMSWPVFADVAQNTLSLTFSNLDNAGTAQQLASASSSLWVQSVTIQANPANSGNVFVANSASNASGTARLTIEAGKSLILSGRDLPPGNRALINLNDVYWDGATVGDDIVWSYIQ